MTKKYSFFDPEHPGVLPVKEIDNEFMLLHCQDHQNCSEYETNPEHAEMYAYIEDMRRAFRIRLVSTTICPTCFEARMKAMEEIDK